MCSNQAGRFSQSFLKRTFKTMPAGWCPVGNVLGHWQSLPAAYLGRYTFHRREPYSIWPSACPLTPASDVVDKRIADADGVNLYEVFCKKIGQMFGGSEEIDYLCTR